MDRQHHRRPRRLREVKGAQDAANLGQGLAHADALIGAPIGLGIKPLASEKVILDELDVGGYWFRPATVERTLPGP